MIGGIPSITVSSVKTWKAVVDSSDRGLARRYMLLWLLTLTGVSLEPVADSLLTYRVPMYDGLKIIFAGWLLLAHFYMPKSAATTTTTTLTKPSRRQHLQQQTRIETQLDERRVPRRSEGVQRQGSHTHQEFSVAPGSEGFVTHKYKHEATRISEEGMTTATADHLDFGRFKRNLERRRTSNSVHSNTGHSQRSSLLGDDASAGVRTRHRDDFYAARSASTCNPFDVPTHQSSAESRSRTAPAKERSMPSGTATPERKSSSAAYQFGFEPGSRKRPVSVASSEVVGARSTRSYQQRSGRRRPVQRSQSAMDSYEVDSSSARMTKRLRELLEDEHAQVSSSGGSAQSPSRERVHDRSATLDSRPTDEANYSRSKSPGRERKATLSRSTSTPAALEMMPPPPPPPPKRHNSQESRKQKEPSPIHHRNALSKAGPSLNGFDDVGMKNVQDWLKERNPSLISPPLSATSIELSGSAARLEKRSSGSSQKEITSDLDLQNPQKPYKRKAHHQLAPQTGPKRQAMSDEHILYPQPQDTVASSPRPPVQASSSSHRSPAPHRTESPRQAHLHPPRSVGPTSYRSIPHDPLRDQAEIDPFLPTTNWDRFKKPNPTSLRKSFSSPLTNSASTAEFTFRMATPKKISSAAALTSTYSDDDDDDNPTISPLIKLRQSQLKQRQQEDFYGVKKESGNKPSKFDEEDGGLVFNQVLEAWENGDDETLARNAALEEAEREAYARTNAPRQRQHAQQNNWQQQDEASPVSLSPEDDHVGTSVSRPKSVTPSFGLLRPVAFNGESSRRPQPDLQPKRSLSDPTMQQQQQHPSSNRDHSPDLSQLPLSTRILSSSFKKDDHRSKANFLASTTTSSSSPAKRSTPTANKTPGRQHPGLYTPSKKRSSLGHNEWQDRPAPHSPARRSTTPTLSNRYIQISDGEGI